MEPAHPEFRPDPALDREAMEDLQRRVAEKAVFADDLAVDPASICTDATDSETTPAPLVAGVDQAFVDDSAVSAVVLMRAGEVIERASAAIETEIPYIPGLLAFREGPPIIEALAGLSHEPAVLFLDGSGRIHYRQAGLATHIGLLFDVPAVGVAKSLLCGAPDQSLDDPLPRETKIPIRADDSVEAPAGTQLGYAFQSRQFSKTDRRHVNPLFISPGHRVSADTAVALTEAVGAGYKLPEPIRAADSLAADYKD